MLTIGPDAPAFGSEPETTRMSVVTTYGLDLGPPAGRETLRRRIATAARLVCGQYEAADLREGGDYDRCRPLAIADASAQVDMLIAKAGSRTMSVADSRATRP
jgi:UrcA family protein